MKAAAMFVIFVREWFRDSGVSNEDGESVILNDYMVIAGNARGEQYENNYRFTGHAEWQAEHHEDGDHYGVMVRHGDLAAAERLAAKIERHLAAGGDLNMDHWNRIEGQYGSEAWQEEDAGGFYAHQEKIRDMEAEGIYA